MRQKFNVGDLRISSVTVFKDRAEVTRILETELHAGQNEIVVQELSPSLKEETISVDGKGTAVIQEVQYKSKQLKEEEYPEKLGKFINELDKLKKERQELDDRKEVLTIRACALNRMAMQNPPEIHREERVKPIEPASASEARSVLFDADSLEKVSKFFDLYEEKSTQLSTRMHAIDEEIKKLKKKQRELEEIPIFYTQQSRAMTILLECEKMCTASLEIRYQVSEATWQPSYNIRVNTSSEGDEDLTIVYQGNVSQQTREDWNNTMIILSTSDPSNEAHLQQLGTLKVTFEEEPVVCKKTISYKEAIMEQSSGDDDEELNDDVDDDESRSRSRDRDYDGNHPQYEHPAGADAVRERQALRAAEAVVDEGRQSFAAVFKIDRQASVPSDSGDHKVTITRLQVKPTILHRAVPRHSSNVYITALAVNESQFPFLEGTAATHFNNSFVSNSRMARVLPGEKFTCNLGIDPSVAIDYRPSHETSSKVGPVVKIARLRHEQTIVVHNKRQKAKILLILQENLPKSDKERIQVILNSPKVDKAAVSDEMAPGARLNAANNLEWTLSLEPGEKAELCIDYNIDHPVNKKIRFSTTST